MRISDWSSDVCSSDLRRAGGGGRQLSPAGQAGPYGHRSLPHALVRGGLTPAFAESRPPTPTHVVILGLLSRGPMISDDREAAEAAPPRHLPAAVACMDPRDQSPRMTELGGFEAAWAPAFTPQPPSLERTRGGWGKRGVG